VLNLALERFKRAWPVLVVSYFINLFITQAVSQGPGVVILLASPESARSTITLVVQIVTGVTAIALSAFFQAGFLRICIAAARGQAPQIGMLFSGGDRWLAMLGFNFLAILGLAIGLALLIVPAVLFGLGIYLAPYFLVDANMGPIEAMTASWDATRGQRGKLFGFGLLCFLIMIAGLAACCIGIIPATDLVYLAGAIVYTRISGRGVALPDAPQRL
jgi:uncharacterized membrane protein